MSKPYLQAIVVVAAVFWAVLLVLGSWTLAQCSPSGRLRRLIPHGPSVRRD